MNCPMHGPMLRVDSYACESCERFALAGNLLERMPVLKHLFEVHRTSTFNMDPIPPPCEQALWNDSEQRWEAELSLEDLQKLGDGGLLRIIFVGLGAPNGDVSVLEIVDCDEEDP